MKSKKTVSWGFVSLCLLSWNAALAAGGKAHVFFLEPKDGAAVSKKFTVRFSVEGMKVKPAGIPEASTGHHHLIVDGQPVPKGQVVPKDETHLHYGNGQSQAELELPAGPHTLTLQFADGSHVSYGPDLSKTIHINVK